ncbi:MAG: pantoate--beta-alanine ligase [Deltaproteobacteria bacterium]|jgi:pantoate--beta-alanine ligase|nr:pantoate--beta-alanine ligase [Deltaproteobacteria bacterium]MBW2510550.1 pantoate--beta-alanine ligase [Deltaproteobacteria bacterium]
MQTIKDIKEMQAHCLAARSAGQTIAFVPTMGYLHEGHMSLLHEGRKRGDLLVLSIFVNPTQFGQGEDLERYPRDFNRDETMARECDVDLIFYPDTASIYPDGYATYVTVEGPLTNTLEGACRPTHFRGVTTVVTKLLTIVMPHVALFGRKDFQQLAVIRRMAADLNLPVEILGMPIIRESDGLAMSSRNVYLSASERQQALSLVVSLNTAASVVKAGERAASVVLAKTVNRLESEPDLEVDYVKICNAETLEEVNEIDQESVMLLAVKVGKTRLIDNGLLMEQT